MKNKIVFSVALLGAFLIYQQFPQYYFSKLPDCVPSFSHLDSVAYEMAVMQTLSDKQPSDFRYLFHTFIHENGKDYMFVNMVNEDYCFYAKLRVLNWDKLKGMRQTNGVSYPKELYGLRWKLKQEKGRVEVVFEDMINMID